MSHADQLLADLRAAEQAAKESYLAAVGDESVSVAAFSRLGREYAAATAKYDGAREMLRACIVDCTS